MDVGTIILVLISFVVGLLMFVGGCVAIKEKDTGPGIFVIIIATAIFILVGLGLTQIPNGLPKTKISTGEYYVQVVPNMNHEDSNLVKLLIERCEEKEKCVSDYYVFPRDAFESGVPENASKLIVSEKRDYRGKKIQILNLE